MIDRSTTQHFILMTLAQSEINKINLEYKEHCSKMTKQCCLSYSMTLIIEKMHRFSIPGKVYFIYVSLLSAVFRNPEADSKNSKIRLISISFFKVFLISLSPQRIVPALMSQPAPLLMNE